MDSVRISSWLNATDMRFYSLFLATRLLQSLVRTENVRVPFDRTFERLLSQPLRTQPHARVGRLRVLFVEFFSLLFEDVTRECPPARGSHRRLLDLGLAAKCL